MNALSLPARVGAPRWRWWPFAALTLAFLAGYGPRHVARSALVAEASSTQRDLLRVEVATAKVADGHRSLTLPSSLTANREALISARATGYIGRWAVDIGDYVRAGDLLALIDAPELSQRNIDVGSLVTAGGAPGASSTLPLFRIEANDLIRVFVRVPQTFAGSVEDSEAAAVSIRQLPGRVLAGRVTRTAGSLDPTTRTLNVEVDLRTPSAATHCPRPGERGDRRLARRCTWRRWTAPGTCGSSRSPAGSTTVARSSSWRGSRAASRSS